jgi:predicted Fe-S protein YdhL (DUF1289 family)
MNDRITLEIVPSSIRAIGRGSRVMAAAIRYHDAGEVMIASPCIGICRIEERSGLCLGCARFGDEIAMWREMPEDRRQAVWAELPERRKGLGLNVHRLKWHTKDIRSFVSETLRPGGTWITGVLGAVAEFCLGEDEACDIEIEANLVRAVSPRGAISFELGENLRALSFGSQAGQEIIVLALPRREAKVFPGQGLICLGPDRDAIRDRDQHEILYDFGLGRRAIGFGIRTACTDLMALLDHSKGLDWRQFLPSIGADIQNASPTRVVRNAVGRIEVFTAIPPPDGKSPEGPHTHFLPAYLIEGGDLPSKVDMPKGYVACATYYP